MPAGASLILLRSGARSGYGPAAAQPERAGALGNIDAEVAGGGGHQALTRPRRRPIRRLPQRLHTLISCTCRLAAPPRGLLHGAPRSSPLVELEALAEGGSESSPMKRNP